MRLIKKIILPLAVLILLNSVFGGTGYTTNNFSDVSEEEWFYETLLWAIDQQLIQGYTDGTFRPNAAITEAEFLAILFRLVDHEAVQFNIERHGGDFWKNRVIAAQEQAKSPVEDGQFWAANIYLASEALHIGIKDESNRTQPLTRGEVAILLVKCLSSQTFPEEGAVNYLLNSGLSQGKTEATYTGFAPEELLTRAETLTFLKRLTTPISRPQVSLN